MFPIGDSIPRRNPPITRWLLIILNSLVLVFIPHLFIPLFFEIPALLFLGMWALPQFFSGTLALAAGSYVRGIAWWAHVGGLLQWGTAPISFRAAQRRLPAAVPR